jgi:hypothetical protein
MQNDCIRVFKWNVENPKYLEIGYVTALNSVSLRTFQKISGDLYYKAVYQVMDPARGVYRIIGANSMRIVVRIYP